jgi:hypothetical protein
MTTASITGHLDKHMGTADIAVFVDTNKAIAAVLAEVRDALQHLCDTIQDNDILWTKDPIEWDNLIWTWYVQLLNNLYPKTNGGR